MSRRQHSTRSKRDIQVWLIGTGIASLAGAVYLLDEGKVSASRIHILEADRGYVFAGEDNMYEQGGMCPRGERCTTDLLSRVPSPFRQYKSLLDAAVGHGRGESYHARENDGQGIQIQNLHATLAKKDQMHVVRFMLGSEQELHGKCIQQCFGKSFFESKLWQTFSARFTLQPWHSAVEFHRHLCKYTSLGQSGTIPPGQEPNLPLPTILSHIELYLRGRGVDFDSRMRVSNVKMLPEHDPTHVSEIECIQNNKMTSIPIHPDDLVIITLGSINSGSLFGSHNQPPAPISSRAENIMNGYWSLWFKLAKQSAKFGNPAAFCTHISESKLETFTITLKGRECLPLYMTLASSVGCHNILPLPQSNWAMCISQNPSSCPPSFSGYALFPERLGNFIQKPMCVCSGEEILYETILQLGLPFDVIPTGAVTVPCLMPLATSPLLKRDLGDRPEVIPPHTENVALVGQFAEIKDETAGVEGSVRSAQIAVYGLMGLDKCVPRVDRNILVVRYGQHS